MYKEKFDELWSKTVNSVMFGISAKEIKGKKRLNEYLHGIIWEHSWGNKKLVPPERKLLNDIHKENPQKALELESILSNISVGTSPVSYVGIVVAVLGIILLFTVGTAQIMLKIIFGAICVLGIVIAVVSALQCNYNPKKAVSSVLSKTKEKCDNVLS